MLFDLGNHVFEKRDGGAAIIDVAGPVVHAQKMTSIGQVGGDRKVTARFAMVRIVAAMRPADSLSRAQDRAVDINGQRADAQELDLLGNNLGVEGLQGFQSLVGTSQKRADTAVGGQVTQTAKPLSRTSPFRKFR